jgi:methionyl-tRNA formyltransferase
MVRVVFYGTGSNYSTVVLEQLMLHSMVVAVVVPAPGASGSRPFKRLFLRYASRRIRRVAKRGGVPVLEYPSAQAAADALRLLGPELIVVASFPARLPLEVCAAASIGAINVHPSLLPAHRGADPLFWSYFENDATTGVTLHWIDAGLDTGDVIAQESLPIPRGSTARSLAARIADTGARLLLAQLPFIANGTAPRNTQEGGCTDPLPSRAAWRIDWDEWRAERLWHFLRGVGAAHGHRLIDRQGCNRPTGEAVSWEAAVPGSPAGTIEATRAGVRISCVDGYVIARRPPLLLRLLRYGSLLRRSLRRPKR